MRHPKKYCNQPFDLYTSLEVFVFPTQKIFRKLQTENYKALTVKVEHGHGV